MHRVRPLLEMLLTSPVRGTIVRLLGVSMLTLNEFRWTVFLHGITSSDAVIRHLSLIPAPSRS